MSAFQLKIIAIIAMTLNHVAHVFGGFMPNWLYYICYGAGGLTFPIMACLMTEGYKYTRNFKRYALRLLLFALLALVPFGYALGFAFNVLFTLLLGLICIYLSDHMKSRVGFVFVAILLTLVTLVCDWALMGVPMILCYHKIKNKHARLIIPVSIAWCFMALFSGLNLLVPGNSWLDILPDLLFGFVGCSATIPLLLAYNGEKGPSVKYLFYAYYPAHLLVLSVLKFFLL